MSVCRRSSDPVHHVVVAIGALFITASFVLSAIAQPPPPRYTTPETLGLPGPLQGGSFQYLGPVTAAAVAPDGRRIAYGVGYQDAKVWVADLPTGRHSLLISEFQNARVVALEWSHDGRRLLSVTSGTGGSVLHVSSTLSRDTRAVAAMQRIEDAHWNPNEDLVVFSGLSDLGWDLFLANTTSAKVTPLTESGHDSYSSWSSDGRTVLFSRVEGNLSNIWEVSVNGNATQVTSYAARSIRPVEGINGTIAFLSSILGGWSVYTTSRTGGFQNLVVYNLTRAVVNVSSDSHLYWSPDGTKLLIETASSGTSFSYLVYMNATVTLTANSYPPSKRSLYVPGSVRYSPLVFDLARIVGRQVDAVGWFGNQYMAAIDQSVGTLVLVAVGPSVQVSSSVYGR